jgi:hypothetical protein
MPYEKCVRYNGKTYCWNFDKEQFEEIISKPIDIEDCPEIVIYDLLRLIGRELKERGSRAV